MPRTGCFAITVLKVVVANLIQILFKCFFTNIFFVQRCAGLCCYEGHGMLCSIRLSQPLLRLRPRKDLVETLLVS